MNPKRYFILILTIILSATFLSIAQESIKISANCNLKPSADSHQYYSPLPSGFMRSDNTSEFELTFINATSEQEAAVTYAAEIWSKILVSDVPVKVLVTFYPMSNFLGQCVSNMVKDYPGAPITDTWYVSSLADAITGSDQQPEEYDMDIFLTTSTSWYLDLDGNCPSNKYDLVDVTLHEMGHGLGYFGLGFEESGIGSFGYVPVEVLTRPIVFSFPDLEGMATNYDKYIVNGSGNYLTDSNIFTNPSEELAEQFLSNDLFFNGTNALSANSNNPVKLYAPSTFYFASSLLHLDENTYPAGNINALMTPYSSSGEAKHNPGPITIGLLKDLGWEINDSITVGVDEPERIPNSITLEQNYPNPFNPVTNIDYSIPSSDLNQGLFIQVKLEVYNTLGQKVAALVDESKSPGNYTVQFNAADLPSGIYFYTLSAEGNPTISRKMVLMK